MAAFDFDAARRWLQLDDRRTFARRPDSELPFVDADNLAGQGLLLDTCVYIDQMQGRAPLILADLIRQRHVNHSTVAIQELMHTVGMLDPADRRTSGVIAVIRSYIQAMPEHRVYVPDADTLGKAALLSGMLCRIQGYSGDHKLRALHDCVLFLQAQKLGLLVLTGNVGDYDILLQIFPAGRVLFYRQK